MNSSVTLGFAVALGTGVAIGMQGLFTNILGQMAGPLRGGIAIHVGGLLAGMLMVVLVSATRAPAESINITPKFLAFAFLGGTTGMMILMGIATAFPLIGQVAGQGALIFAQMAVAIVVDWLALAGGDPIPMDGRRLLGLLVMAAGAVLLLPQSGTS